MDEVSNWNQAQQYQDRLDEIFCGCHVASNRDDYFSWLKCLWMLYRELAALMNENDSKRIKDLLVALESKVHKWQEGLLNNITQSFSMCEIELRKIHKEKGMLTSMGQNQLPVFD